MSQWKKRSTDNPSSRDISDIVSSMVRSRGFDPSDELFSKAPLDSLSHPDKLGKGASIAANLLINGKNRRFAVIGDYDADGVVSSAILKKTIELFGGTCEVFLPSRWKHGYGLNERTFKDFIARFSGRVPDVLFVVDCGSSSEEYVSGFKKFGIKQIAVIDHHIVNPLSMSVSADAHVNWRIFGSLKNLCAAGEVFQVARLALMRAGKDWEWMLPLAAIATVGDSVPLTGDNRIIVRHGTDTQRMTSCGSPGLYSLVMKRCNGAVSQKGLAFYIVPRINAAGRVADPDIALSFLTESDPATSANLLFTIESHNENRKAIQDKILRQGLSMVGGQKASPPFVFLHNPDWNIGVCGISCSQMVEKFGVPAMMFGTYDGKIRGSGRSVPGVNLKAILDECGEEVFERYGGHEMACGATVRGGMFFEAQMRFAAALSKLSKEKSIVHVPEYDVELGPDQITHELGNAILSTLYPYCEASNPEPVFKVSSAKVLDISIKKYRVYSKVDIVIAKDGKRVSIPLSAFIKNGVDDDTLSIVKDDVADFYFSFPQTEHSDFGFGFGENEYSLELVDVDRRLNG